MAHLTSDDLACPTKNRPAVPNLIGIYLSEEGGGESNPMVRGVVYAVEALQELAPVDEVETLTTGGIQLQAMINIQSFTMSKAPKKDTHITDD